MTAGSAPNPYSGDGAWAVQALLQQAAQVVQQCKQVDTRARQAADLLSSRDDFIAAFVQEHGMLVQLTAHIGSTAREMQQKRVIAGNCACLRIFVTSQRKQFSYIYLTGVTLLLL